MNTCIDCGKSISPKATRCKSCFGLNNIGENNPNYRGALICPSCGGKKKNCSQLCKKCTTKISRGKNHPNWQGGINLICPKCGGKKESQSKVCRNCCNQSGGKIILIGTAELKRK